VEAFVLIGVWKTVVIHLQQLRGDQLLENMTREEGGEGTPYIEQPGVVQQWSVEFGGMHSPLQEDICAGLCLVVLLSWYLMC
jgi:hypothetical protein